MILGPGGVRLDVPAARERPEFGLGGLDELLGSRPDVAIVTGTAESCFFRASLALERGVKQVVVQHGALPEQALAQLAYRARTFGGCVHVHGDRVGEHVPVSVPHAPPEGEVGCPDLGQWATALGRAGADPVARAEIGWSVTAEGRAAARAEPPLELDRAAQGFPTYFEQVAWAAGLKPVLYLVVPEARAKVLRDEHPQSHAIEIADRVAVQPATGARSYGQGEAVVHVFMSHDRRAAERASQLWLEGSGRHSRELGSLMGYPPCCVAAFEAFESRGNNAALVYVTRARTVALGAPFHPLLNGVVTRLVPFTPCSYGCPAAVVWAERLVRALPSALALEVRAALGRPVLYFDQARAVVLVHRGEHELGASESRGPDELCFASARWLPGEGAADEPEALHARRTLGRLLGTGGRLSIREHSFDVVRGDGEHHRLSRGLPRLGLMLPFDAAPPAD